MSDISAFVAFGKRFTVDVKLHSYSGIRQCQREFMNPSAADLYDICLLVGELACASRYVSNRDAGERLLAAVRALVSGSGIDPEIMLKSGCVYDALSVEAECIQMLCVYLLGVFCVSVNDC